MTSKDIVKRAIEFNDPTRMPICIWNMDTWNQGLCEVPDMSNAPVLAQWMENPQDDIVCIDYLSADGEAKKKAVGQTRNVKIDEFGVLWTDGNAGKAPIDTWDKWNTYNFPDLKASSRFSKVDEQIKASKDKYILGLVWNTTYEGMWMLRGFENLLMDPIEHPKMFFELRDRYLEFQCSILDSWLKTDIDAVYFGDDLGTQTGLLMSPDMWRRYYKPMIKTLFSKTREAGKCVFFHSCGNITQILPDLVDCGMNVLNPVQPNTMDVQAVLEEFGNNLTIWGATDLQHIINFGNPEDIERDIKKTVTTCWRNGGYIGGTAQGCAPDTPVENIEAFYRAFSTLSGKM